MLSRWSEAARAESWWWTAREVVVGLDAGAEGGGGGVADRAVTFPEHAEGVLPHPALGTLEQAHVAALRDFDLLAVGVGDVAELEVGVGEQGEGPFAGAEDLARAGEQRLLLAAQGVRLLADQLLQRVAVRLERRIVGPGAQGPGRLLEEFGLDPGQAPGDLGVLGVEPGQPRLAFGVAGVLVGAVGGVDPEAVHGAVEDGFEIVEHREGGGGVEVAAHFLQRIHQLVQGLEIALPGVCVRIQGLEIPGVGDRCVAAVGNFLRCRHDANPATVRQIVN